MSESIIVKQNPIEKFFRGDKRVWKLLIVINIAIHLLGVLSEFIYQTNYLFIYGAKINFFIADKQIYRLVTSMFLHAGFFHLLANCYAIYALGEAVEEIFGTKKFLIIYFIAGIIGSLASFILSPHNALGASGGIFGFFGVHLYLYLRKPDVYKKIFGKSIFFLLALNLYIGFSNPQIDNYAHVGGLVGGFLACFIVGLKQETVLKARNMAFGFLVFTIIVVGTLLGISTRDSSPDYFYQKVIISFQLEKYDTGVEALQEGLTQYPENANLLELYNLIYQQ